MRVLRLREGPEEAAGRTRSAASEFGFKLDRRVAFNGLAPGASVPQHRAMLARVFSAAVQGIEAFPLEVEVNAGWGETIIVIVGLPDAAVKESRDRVSTALGNSGFKFPMGRTTINLAPADVKKEGPSFDQPIAGVFAITINW